MKARTIDASAVEPTYLKISLYKPKLKKSGIEIAIEATKTHHWSAFIKPHWSILSPKENQTLKTQIKMSKHITSALLMERGKFSVASFAFLIDIF